MGYRKVTDRELAMLAPDYCFEVHHNLRGQISFAPNCSRSVSTQVARGVHRQDIRHHTEPKNLPAANGGDEGLVPEFLAGVGV